MERATLIKCIPIKRTLANGKTTDSILIFYRDENGEKKTEFIDRAESSYYILKDKESEEAITQPLFIKKEKLEKVTTFSDTFYRDIAVRTDALPYYDRVMLNFGENSTNMKNLMKHPYLYDADMDLADRYIRNFHDKHPSNPNYKLYKCYFDIEVDIINYNGFPDEEIAPCPVNIITIIDGREMKSYSFVVRNKENKSLIEFEEKIEEFKVYLNEKILIEDQVSMNGIYIDFFDTELEAIEKFFEKVHDIDPDFMLAWNEAFDVISLQNRLKKNYNNKKFNNPELQNINSYDMMVNTVCDSKYMIQKAELGKEYYLTPKAKYSAQRDKSIVDRMDSFNVLDGIQWLDMMLLYANLRKSSGMRESYSLDYISGLELGKEKLQFGPGETIKNLPWKNFAKFAEYNIRKITRCGFKTSLIAGKP